MTDSAAAVAAFRLRVSLLRLFCALLLCCTAARAAERVDLLISGGTIVTMDPEHRLITDGAVAIRAGRIVAVGPRAEVERRYTAAEKIDAAGHAVMPGLINTHTHAAMSLFRGLAGDVRLSDWLEKYIFPAEARNVTPDFVRWGTHLGAAEMIRGGTTTYADMYYFEDVVAEVTKEAGLRGVLGQTILDFPAPDHKTASAALAATEKFLRRWQGDPLVVAAVAPHSPYVCSAGTLTRARDLAARYRAPILIHLAETREEADLVRRFHRDPGIASPVVLLDRLGLLGPRTLGAHAIWVSDDDIEMMRRKGTSVAHNTSSNMMLASGVAPVQKMLAAGIAVGLGTDGVAGTNNDLNMFEEMDLSAKLAKITSDDPRALPAERVLEMATLTGARALGMGKEIGSLEPGKRADLITVRLRTVHTAPIYKLQSQLVYSAKASDVDDVVVEGRVLMRGRRLLTLNEQRILDEAERFAARVRRSLEDPAVK